MIVLTLLVLATYCKLDTRTWHGQCIGNLGSRMGPGYCGFWVTLAPRDHYNNRLWLLNLESSSHCTASPLNWCIADIIEILGLCCFVLWFWWFMLRELCFQLKHDFLFELVQDILLSDLKLRHSVAPSPDVEGCPQPPRLMYWSFWPSLNLKGIYKAYLKPIWGRANAPPKSNSYQRCQATIPKHGNTIYVWFW